MFKRQKGLSHKEIDSALDKIRERYNYYIINFFKDISLKSAFEDRYISALTSGMDMELFIRDELADVEKYIQSEKNEPEEIIHYKDGIRPPDPEPVGFADRVIDDMKKRISIYPKLDIHIHASDEVARIYGAMDIFYERHWSSFLSFFEKNFPAKRKKTIPRLEDDLYALTSSGKKRLPKKLEKYYSLLTSDDSYHHDEAAREVQVCIKYCAFFLHRIDKEITEAFKEGYQNEILIDVQKYVKQVISDFRIHDIKSQE